MLTKFMWIKKKPAAAVVICAILIASVALWQISQVTEAAILNPHPGLLGWWRFDEGSGTVAQDSSGSGNSGTIHGTDWITVKSGYALNFDGNDDVVIPDSISLSNIKTGLTFEFWTYRTNDNGGYLILKQDAFGLKDVGSNNFIFWTSHTDTSEEYVFSTNALTLNNWHYVQAVWSAGNKKVYVDGVEVGEKTNSKTTNLRQDANLPVYLGNSAWWHSQNFTGTLDEIRVYNRALSAAEIQDDFQKNPNFSSNILAKVPKGTTQVITTLSWQGIGTINVTIQSPTNTYNETTVPVYQKTTYSTTEGASSMLNVKRLSVSVTALSSDQDWYIVLKFDQVEDYRITVEVQK